MHHSCWKAYLLQRASCLKVCLINGNPTPDLPSMVPVAVAVQVQQWAGLWKFPDAFTGISSHLTLNRVRWCFIWNRKAVSIWLYPPTAVGAATVMHFGGKRSFTSSVEKPHPELPYTSGNVPPVFGKRWISPNMRFTTVMRSLPRQETPPAPGEQAVCEESTEFLDFRLLLQGSNLFLLLPSQYSMV